MQQQHNDQTTSADPIAPIGAVGSIPPLPKVKAAAPKLEEPPYIDTLANLTKEDIVKRLVDGHEQQPWREADETFVLSRKRGLELNEIVALAKASGAMQQFSIGHLSQIAATAETFPHHRRFRFLSFTAHQKVGQDIKRINKGRKKDGKEPLDPFAVLTELFDAEPSAKALSESKLKIKVRDHVRGKSPGPIREPGDGLTNVCLHADCIEIAKRFAPNSAALVNLDPVYADYTRTDDGKLDDSTSKGFANADNDSRDEAIGSTVAALKAYAHVPRVGGIMTLWQSDRPLRPEIYAAIEEIGYEAHILPWLKRDMQQIGRMNGRVGGAIEVCYVLTRKGETSPHDIDAGRLPPVLDFKPVNMADISQPHHMFEKPVDMMRRLVEAFTPKGTHCVDAFACTGSLSKACIETGRTFTYIEKNEANFEHFAGIVQRLRDEAKARSEERPAEEKN